MPEDIRLHTRRREKLKPQNRHFDYCKGKKDKIGPTLAVKQLTLARHPDTAIALSLSPHLKQDL
jgi:hypothetical protein